MMDSETTVHVIGVEPEGPDPDRPPLSGLLGHCGLLMGGRRHIEGLSAYLPPGARLLAVTNNISEAMTALKDFVAGAKGMVAIVLATGDPLYHGIGGPISRAIPRHLLSFTPATTLVQRAFSLLGEPWEEAKVASIHGKKEDPVLSPGRWIFYTGGGRGPAQILEISLRQGLEVREMTVLEEIGLPGQKVTTFCPVDAGEINSREFRTLNMVVMTLEEKTDRKNADI